MSTIPPSRRKKADMDFPPLSAPQHQGDELIGTAQLSQVLDVHPNTVRSMVLAQRIPFRKIGRDFRYRLPDVLAALSGLD